MKDEIRDAWVAALRSEKYTQGRFSLKHHYKNEIKYCCLGVLCEVYQELNPENQLKVYKEEFDTRYQFEGKIGTLPDKVMKWAGLDSDDPKVKIDLELKDLSALNDTDVPFNEIADLIEEQL